MLKQHASTIRGLQVLADGVAIVAGYASALAIRALLRPWLTSPFEIDWTSELLLLSLVVPLWLLLIHAHGLYATQRRSSAVQLSLLIARIAAIGTVITVFVAFLLRIEDLSRSVILIFGGTAFLFLLAVRIVARGILQNLRRLGYNYRVLLIIGTSERALRFGEIITERARWGLRLAGFIQADSGPAIEQIDGIRVLGTLADVREILDEKVVDEVCIFDLAAQSSEFAAIVAACEEVGVETTILVDSLYRGAARPLLYEWYGFHLLTYGRGRLREAELLVKPLFDWTAAAVLTVITAPLMAVTALAIKLTSRGPIIYRQVRVGRHGRLFTLYKFRSMVVGAEELQESILDQNEQEGPIFKIRDDPRITPVGRLLRRSSLDELPQLFNVLKREMSLVGPRPPIPSEVTEYHRFQRRRLSVMPGITGLWQVSGRSELSFEESTALDLEYIDTWTFWLDLRIIARTLRAIVLGTGAY